MDITGETLVVWSKFTVLRISVRYNHKPPSVQLILKAFPTLPTFARVSHYHSSFMSSSSVIPSCFSLQNEPGEYLVILSNSIQYLLDSLWFNAWAVLSPEFP